MINYMKMIVKNKYLNNYWKYLLKETIIKVVFV